jgi:hypothetical protein
MTLVLAVTAGAVVGGALGGVGWWLAGRYEAMTVAERRAGDATQRRAVYASRLRPLLRDELGIGDKIEYDIRGDRQAQQRLSIYARRVEDWRTSVGTFLSQKLPDSGADTKFLGFRPRVGQGGVMYEYERLNDMRGHLIHIIDNLETYCSRSSSLSEGVSGLVKLRAEGVTLRNRSVTFETQCQEFHHDFEEWQRVVGREMRSVGVRTADVGFFTTLDLVPMLTFSNAYNDSHAKDLRELTEKLRRLQEIIQRHDQPH